MYLSHQTTFQVKSPPKPFFFFATEADYDTTKLAYIACDCHQAYKDVNLKIGTQLGKVAIQNVNNHFYRYTRHNRTLQIIMGYNNLYNNLT